MSPMVQLPLVKLLLTSRALRVYPCERRQLWGGKGKLSLK